MSIDSRQVESPVDDHVGGRGGGGIDTAGRFSPRRVLSNGAFAVLFLSVFVFVVLPILLLVINTFQLGTIGQPEGWGLGQWRDALSSPRIGSALWNTVSLAATRQIIAIVVGVLLAWLIARTDLPGRNVLEFGFWIAVFLPGLTVTLSWIMILDQTNGVANILLERLPFVTEGPFNIFSWWGIVWVHLMTGTIPVKVMLLAPAFRNFDASLEEAGWAAGDSKWGVLRRVSIPLLMPTLLVVLVLGLIRSFEAFEIELILGVPAGIEVLSSLIYRLAADSSPPQYGQATIVSLLAVAIMLPAIIVQQRYGARHAHATVSGRFRGNVTRLGRWRWPAFALVFGLVTLMTIVPVAFLLLGTFMRFFGVFTAKSVWTFEHWQAAMSSPLFGQAFMNSIYLALATTILAVVWFSTIAYVIVRTRFRARTALDFFVWFPSIIPGVVLGLGYLWLFLGVPGLRLVYGTIIVLVLVAALGSMTLTSQVVKMGLTQLGTELEEASWASGAGRLYTIRRVIVPLIAPTLVVVAVTAFSVTARTTSHVALLATSSNQPLSILQLNQMAENNYEAASVVGVFILLLTVGVALAARILGYRAR